MPGPPDTTEHPWSEGLGKIEKNGTFRLPGRKSFQRRTKIQNRCISRRDFV